MASAWPQLENLELIDARDILLLHRIAEITLHGLISLLRLCPNLRFFDLAIDATKLDGLRGDKPGGGVCNRLIKHPKLVDSPISDPEMVARILLDILPELDPSFMLNNTTMPREWFQIYRRMLASKKASGPAM